MRREVLCVLVVCVFASACADAPTRQNGPELSDEAVRASQNLDAGRADANRPYFGTVHLRQDEASPNVFAAFDGGEGGAAGADGVIDQVFLLQREPGAPPVDPVSIEDARVVFEGKSVTISDRESRHGYRLTVAGDAPDAGGKVTHLAGYGLSRRSGLWPVAEGVTLQQALESTLQGCRTQDAFGAVIQSYCDSGGEGSTSCSISCGCSVSCGSGYHSCCDADKCSCTCQKTAVLPPAGDA